jgi:hypothetical protein
MNKEALLAELKNARKVYDDVVDRYGRAWMKLGERRIRKAESEAIRKELRESIEPNRDAAFKAWEALAAEKAKLTVVAVAKKEKIVVRWTVPDCEGKNLVDQAETFNDEATAMKLVKKLVTESVHNELNPWAATNITLNREVKFVGELS